MPIRMTILLMSIAVLWGCEPQLKPDSSTATAPEERQSTVATSTRVDEEIILNADSSGWLSHGRTYSEQRHSPLADVNLENVDTLGLAWSFDLNANRGIEATPIVHDGVMYVTSTWNIVSALDARNGSLLWQFDPQVDKEQAAKGCCDAVNRGVAIWGDAVFTATLDGRLISLDAKTGKKNWDVLTIDPTHPYTITGAPRIIKGKVIIGNGGAEMGVRGYVSAYAVDSGAQLWRFYTVPGNPENGFESDTMEMAAKTWNGEYWAAGGGGTVWDSMAYDPELNLLYIGVGNGSPWNQSIRSPEGGDNLFLSSIVALNPDNGDYVWHYQTTPGETWDYTATQHMILAELEIDGQQRNVIMQAPKNGFFYVIDRATGELISAENFVPVTWATHIDKETGRPVETPNARFGASPLTAEGQPNLQLPGPLGAHNWHPMAFNPDTGLVYIPAQEAPWLYVDQQGYKKTVGWNTGTDFQYAVLPSDKAMFVALKSMLKGRLLAWDPVKQEPAWAFEHQGPWNGGVLSTAGGLVFQGSADAHFAAYDAKTGDVKWKFFSQTGIVAAPITYQLDGEQYIAVAAGWGGSYVLGFGGVMPTGSQPNAARVLVFKLGAEGQLPELETDKESPEPTIPARLEVAPEVIQLGSSLYANNCVACHGDQAYSSGLVPNLRYSPMTADANAFSAVVLEGALAKRGMPNFGERFSKEEVEAMRAYIIEEANSDRGQEYYQSVQVPTQPASTQTQ